jgi:hypothetical protein
LPSAAKWRSIRYVSFPSGDPRIGTGKVDPPKEWQPVMKDHGRHHIIARPVLLAVWNGLAGAFIDTQLPEARTAVRQYLLLCGAPAANLDSLIDRIRAVQKTQQRAGHHHLPTLEAWEIDPIQRAVIWPAWNIVVGPVRADRDDDPEDRNRDKFDRFTAGLTSTESAGMRAVERLFRQMQFFLATAPPTAASLRAFTDAVNFGRQTLRNCEPIPYRPDMWAQGADGKWRKARGAGA